MFRSRRKFLADSSLCLLGLAAASRCMAQDSTDLPPGAPPAFGTTQAVGPEVSPRTFAEAEKLVQVQLSDGEQAMAANSWRTTMAALYERRTGALERTFGVVDERPPGFLDSPTAPIIKTARAFCAPYN